MTKAASEAEVLDFVREARAAKRGFEIVAGGTRRAAGKPMFDSKTGGDLPVLDVSGLSGIVKYEPEELILTAKPGTTLAEVKAALAEKNQCLGFDPVDWVLFGSNGTATLGGAAASDASGSGRLRHGAARDSLLGFRAVNGLGEAFGAGSKVVKNVTGFDLPKLMCGAFGTLGVLSELTFRVYPRPRCSSAIVLKDIAPEAGFAALRKIWQSALEPTGLAYLPGQTGLLADIGQGAALIRFEAAALPLREKCAAARLLLGEVQALDNGDALFAALGSGAVFADSGLDVWKLFLPPSEAARVAAAIAAPLWLGDWAGGLLWIGAPGEDATRIRAIATEAGGNAMLLRGPPERRAALGMFAPQPAALAAINARVKAAFDPLSLFNPGQALMRNEFSAAQLADPQMAEAALAVRTCVHCGICTATCPTYVLLGDERDGPRGRIVQMQKMLEPGGTVSAEAVLHVDRCLSCLNCRSACPSGVDYQRLVDEARVHIQDHYRRPVGERLLRWIIAKVMTRPKLVALGLALAPLGAWLPGKLGVMARTGAAARPRVVAPAGPVLANPVQRIAIMPGCVQAAMAPQIDEAVTRVLARRGIALVPLAGAGCCGALPHHLGRAEDARAWARRAIEAYETGAYDGVLITATGCSAHLKDYAHLFAGDPVWEPRARAFAESTRDFLELVTPMEGRPQSLRVAYHPACSMTNGLKLGGMGEALLAASGFTLVPFGESHLCCGSAGSYSILQPELSGQLRDRKLAQLRAADPDLVVSGNIGCLQQLGTGVPVLHLAELLDWAEGGPTLLPGKVELPAKPR